MIQKEADDCLHALGQTYAFFGKELDAVQVGFWRQFFCDKQAVHALQAIKDYALQGRYAPKPKDILECYDKLRDAEKVQQSFIAPALESPKCSAEISLAWRYWLPRFYGDDLGGITGQVGDVSPEQAEKLLFIVNREAKRVGEQSAVPEPFRLQEVWQ